MGYGQYGGGSSNRIGNATHEKTVAAWVDQAGDVNGSRMFCEGASIYSYGRHFKIAEHFQHDGKRFALFNDASYSPTTSGHQSHVSGAAEAAGITILPSHNMRAGDSYRRDDALHFARKAVSDLEEKRRSTDLWVMGKTQVLMSIAGDHEALYSAPIPELAPLRQRHAEMCEAYIARAARIYGKRTASAFVDLFAYEGLTGEFISAGHYFTPNYDGKLERKLCAYWRVSDGRFARIVKSYGRNLETTFLKALPSDLAKGV